MWLWIVCLLLIVVFPVWSVLVWNRLLLMRTSPAAFHSSFTLPSHFTRGLSLAQVYAFGILLFELITGSEPYPGKLLGPSQR